MWTMLRTLLTMNIRVELSLNATCRPPSTNLHGDTLVYRICMVIEIEYSRRSM